MRDLTSPSGSDLSGHVVPQIVYAGKTPLNLFMYLCTDYITRSAHVLNLIFLRELLGGKLNYKYINYKSFINVF